MTKKKKHCTRPAKTVKERVRRQVLSQSLKARWATLKKGKRALSNMMKVGNFRAKQASSVRKK